MIGLPNRRTSEEEEEGVVHFGVCLRWRPGGFQQVLLYTPGVCFRRGPGRGRLSAGGVLVGRAVPGLVASAG